LKVIKEHLDKQKQEEEYGQEKLSQYVETRVRALNENVFEKNRGVD